MKHINHISTDAAGIAALQEFEDLMMNDLANTEKRHKVHRSKVKRQRKKDLFFK